MQYSLNKDLQHLKWQQLRSWISSPDCLVAMDKQQTQYQLYPDQNGRCLQIMEKLQNRSVQTFGFVYHDTNGQNHGPVWKTQSFLLSGICTVIFGKTIVGKAIWENPIETWLEENSTWRMSLCRSWDRIILICVCGWHKVGWKETQYWSDVECTQQRSRFGRPNIFLGSCFLGMHSKKMRNKQRYCGTMLESRISAGGLEKLPFPQNLRISSWSNDMVGHAKKCVERYCELANKTTQQLYKVSTPCIDDHHFNEEMKSVGELSHVCSQIFRNAHT